MMPYLVPESQEAAPFYSMHLFIQAKTRCSPLRIRIRVRGGEKSPGPSGRAKRAAQVQQFTQLVKLLHQLIPSGHNKVAHMTTGTSTGGMVNLLDLAYNLLNMLPRQPDRGDWRAEVQQSLLKIERMERELEGKMEDLLRYGLKLTGAAENRRKIYAWLGHTSSELFEEAKSKRLDGTCDWILDHPSFREWLSTGNPTSAANLLWINGGAGFGKTVLCTRMVEHLISTLAEPVAYFFLSSEFESRDDPFAAVRAWMVQIIAS